MSRSYNMYIEIDGVDSDKLEAVQEAAGGKWLGFSDDWWEDRRQVEGENSRTVLSSSGDGYLSGGMSEDEFTIELAKAIWRANGRYCEVLVNATYLEDLPYETYTYREGDYDKFLEETNND